jgi:hypothetical protein
VLEKASKHWQAKPLTNLDTARAVRQRLIQVAAQQPAMREIEIGELDKLAFGTHPLNKHHEVKLEEGHRIDGGLATIRVALGHPRPDEAQVERCVKVALEVVGWDQPF